jgi:type IX secretion system substrate protein/putative pyrroloquinoline-quinone binding quinoprotein
MHNRFSVTFCLFLMLQTASLFSQDIVSEKWYGGQYNDEGCDAVQMDDGGFLITGIYQESYYNDIYLIRTDIFGDTLWTRTYGGSSWDNGRSIVKTFDNNYLIGGRTFLSGSTSSGLACLVKVDENGNYIWQNNYGSSRKDGMYSVIQTSDSGFVFTGQYYYNDIWVLKTDSSGTELWSKTFGFEIGYDIIETMDKNLLVTGAAGSPSDMYIAKLNSADGDTLWTLKLGGAGRDIGLSICNSYDGGYLVAGQTASFGAGGNDIYLAEITSEGDTVSTRTFGLGGDDIGYSICQTPDSGYIICASTNSIGAGLNDIYLLKLDANLDTVWTQTYGGEGNEWAWQILCSNDSNYVVIGTDDGDVYFLNVRESNLTDINTPGEDYLKVPNSFGLAQNFPNPFNPSTKISFSIPQAANVNLKIYDLLGREVAELINKEMKPGSHSINFNAGNLTSGMYFYKIEAGEYSQTRKMILIK